MLRWGLIFFGLILLIGGIGAWRDHEPVEEGAASAVSMHEAFTMVAKGDHRFITLDAEVDRENQFYPTGLKTPYYSRLRPDDVQSIAVDAPAVELAKMSGCAVEVESFVNPMSVLRVQSVAYREDQTIEEGTVNSERYIAPLFSSDNQLFVCSPAFQPGSSESKAWVARQRFTGRLCYLKDLEENVPSLESGMQDIRSIFLREYSVSVSPSAMVILTDANISSPASTTYAPIAGSNNGLFVELGKDDAAPSGTIAGELFVRDGSNFRGFGSGSGGALPSRIGIVEVQTAEQYNSEKEAIAGFGVKYGAMSMVAGIALVAQRRWKKKRLFNRAVGRGLSQSALGGSGSSGGGSDWRRAA